MATATTGKSLRSTALTCIDDGSSTTREESIGLQPKLLVNRLGEYLGGTVLFFVGMLIARGIHDSGNYCSLNVDYFKLCPCGLQSFFSFHMGSLVSELPHFSLMGQLIGTAIGIRSPRRLFKFTLVYLIIPTLMATVILPVVSSRRGNVFLSKVLSFLAAGLNHYVVANLFDKRIGGRVARPLIGVSAIAAITAFLMFVVPQAIIAKNPDSTARVLSVFPVWLSIIEYFCVKTISVRYSDSFHPNILAYFSRSILARLEGLRIGVLLMTVPFSTSPFSGPFFDNIMCNFVIEVLGRNNLFMASLHWMRGLDDKEVVERMGKFKRHLIGSKIETEYVPVLGILIQMWVNWSPGLSSVDCEGQLLPELHPTVDFIVVLVAAEFLTDVTSLLIVRPLLVARRPIMARVMMRNELPHRWWNAFSWSACMIAALTSANMASSNLYVEGSASGDGGGGGA